MSQDQMISFLDKVNKDADTAEALAATIGDKEGAEAERAAVGFAQARGFQVTAEDAAEVRRALRESLDGEGELSDAELEGVAGGGFPVGEVLKDAGNHVLDWVKKW